MVASAGIPEAYRRARLDASSPALALLQKGSPNAVAALHKVMADKATPAAVRVRAADCFLNHAMKAREIEVTEARAPAARTNTEFTELLLVREITQTTALCHREDLGVHLTWRSLSRAVRSRIGSRNSSGIAVWLQPKGKVSHGKRRSAGCPWRSLYLTYTAWEAETGQPAPIPKGSLRGTATPTGSGKRAGETRRKAGNQTSLGMARHSINSEGDD